ncbi:MAG: hypothetical protein AAB551_04390 [Patescibacteria group bacterium]
MAHSLQNSFVIDRKTCLQRVHDGEGVRKTDIPENPVLCKRLESVHARVTGLLVGREEGNPNAGSFMLVRNKDPKIYPNNVSRLDAPRHTNERCETVCGQLAGLILERISASVTNHERPYCYLFEHLNHGETFVNIDLATLAQLSIRIDPGDNKTLYDWLSTRLAEKVTLLLRNIEVDGEKPFSENTFTTKNSESFPANGLSIQINKH